MYKDKSNYDDKNTEKESVENSYVDEYKCEDGTILKKRTRPIVIRYVRYQHSMDSENYFREALLLFHPWRKEANIIGTCETYEEKFEMVLKSTEIKQTMREYNHNWSELDEAMSDVEKRKEDSLEDEWDRVAPTAQQTEREDEEEGVCDIYPEYAPPNTTLSEHSEIPVAASETGPNEEVLSHYMPDNEYSALIRSLNTEQREFFLSVLHSLKTSDEPLHLFLTGGAGVGKTVVVNAIYQSMLRFYNKDINSNLDEAKILLAAPTGTAAFLIRGNTLHTLLKIPVSQKLQYKSLSSEKLNTLSCKFLSVKLLIIDEISMVGNRMLAFINHRLQQVMGSSKLFGGLSILAVGDLYQLKPVFDAWIFENLHQDYGPLASNLWTENFRVFHLVQIMRQKDSEEFAILLNRLREGKHTKEDIGVLKSRHINRDIFNPEYPFNVPHIFLSNKLVDSHNNIVYESSPNSSRIVVHALDVILGDVTKTVKDRVKQSIPNDVSKTMGLSKLFKSAIGLRNEVSCNIDVEDGLTNSAGCIITAVGRISENGKIGHLWVQFEDEAIGKKCRNNNKQLYNGNTQNYWTPIFKVKRQFPVGKYKSVVAMREQFPLRLAAAKTCHRCQGATMESAVLDFTGRSLPHGHYVALSRVKTLDKLYLRELNEKGINTDPLVKYEIDRLNTSMRMISPLTCYTSVKRPQLKLLFQNVRSLKKHIGDMLQDIQYTGSDIIACSETKLKTSNETENYNIHGFNLYRFDCPLKAYGIAVYVKCDIDISSVYHKVYHTSAESVIEAVVLDIVTGLQNISHLKLAIMYSSPKAKWPELKKVIEETKTKCNTQKGETAILTGDLNVDLLDKPTHRILQCVGWKQYVREPTTDTNSLLDHIYISEETHVISTGALECHFSDHKPVFLVLS
ncbi:MAG: AAA family ATPase [Candidatus Thiodiazotropha taylori]|nr:AAA family ATPase [Candidatus Thiodiazotropha taylori]MCW4309475.1 AAA family ATPase [Candidatus Thiodiazotropha endolucinida]